MPEILELDDVASRALASMILEHTASAVADDGVNAADALAALARDSGLVLDVAAGILTATSTLVAQGELAPLVIYSSALALQPDPDEAVDTGGPVLELGELGVDWHEADAALEPPITPPGWTHPDDDPGEADDDDDDDETEDSSNTHAWQDIADAIIEADKAAVWPAALLAVDDDQEQVGRAHGATERQIRVVWDIGDADDAAELEATVVRAMAAAAEALEADLAGELVVELERVR